MTILSMKKSPWLDVLGGGSDTIKESNQIDLYVMRNTSGIRCLFISKGITMNWSPNTTSI
jgi:hypothetical protein